MITIMFLSDLLLKKFLKNSMQNHSCTKIVCDNFGAQQSPTVLC